MISGIKPSGRLTLGNYLGAIKPFIEYQDEYELFVFIADLHALTVHQDPDELRKNSQDILKVYLAAGLDPNKCTVFKQSAIPAHNQLEWILTCNSFATDLLKMPQYKNYLERNKGKAAPAGMLMYPSLMNADILLYDADYVPVGVDQKPHVDFTHDVANYFNRIYGDTFRIPECVVPKIGAKILSLSDPTKKMSKSESDKGTIYLDDSKDEVIKKVLKAKADSEGMVYYDLENKPGISNLLNIYAAIHKLSLDEVVSKFKGETDYKKFKLEVADSIISELARLRDNFPNVDFCDKVLDIGNKQAADIANAKLTYVYKKVGLL